MTTIEQLKQTFCDNFVAYYRTHSLHLNVTGRNFYSDHKLLNKIYDDLQDQIDIIGELIRACGEYAPETLHEIILTSHIPDSTTGPTSDDFLAFALDAQEHLITCYEALEEVAEQEEYDDIENFAADRIKAHRKFVWMLKSTLNEV